MPLDHRHLGTNRANTYTQALAELETDTIRRVNRDMRGQEVSQVHATLAKHLRGRFPGVDFDEGHLSVVATAISRGTLNV